jgi:hypothetical protein
LTSTRTAQTGDVLAEVAEHDARGRVADIYADIRAVLGIPVVNLVYRCLAVEPARLDTIWRTLQPNLTSRAADEAATRLVGTARRQSGAASRSPLTATGIDATELSLAHATLQAYARGNSRNLLAMHTLLDGCPGSDHGGEASDPPRPQAILPMAKLDELTPETLGLLRTISTSLLGDEKPALVPSLLRHFAGHPQLLDLVWRALQPTLPSLASNREDVTGQARRLAAELPFPVSRLEAPEERRIVRRFAIAMSTLLVVGETLGATFPESP